MTRDDILWLRLEDGFVIEAGLRLAVGLGTHLAHAWPVVMLEHLVRFSGARVRKPRESGAKVKGRHNASSPSPR